MRADFSSAEVASDDAEFPEEEDEEEELPPKRGMVGSVVGETQTGESWEVVQNDKRNICEGRRCNTIARPPANE